MLLNRFSFLVLLAGLLCMFCHLPAFAADPAPVRPARPDRLPLWELGFGVAPIAMSAYRGSENLEWYPVPMPYVDYRGDFLRIDREGIRGLIYDSERIRLDLSGDGSIPAESDEEGPRRGMPDLDPVLEFGPSINFILHEGPGSRFRLRMPVRYVAASDLTFISHVGWKVHPHLDMSFSNVLWGWSLNASLGPLFADSGFHEYYYDVKDRYATDFRESYRAGGGYSGTMLMFSSSRRFKNIWAGAFFRYDNLAAAAFIDSPLVETRHAFMIGFGIARIFKTSEKTVPAGRDDF